MATFIMKAKCNLYHYLIERYAVRGVDGVREVPYIAVVGQGL